MKNKKLIIGLLVVGAVGFYFYKKNKNKSKGASSSFTGDDNFFNITAKPKGCEVVSGNVNVPVPYKLDDGRYIVGTGSGSTIICNNIPSTRILAG
jgi:hypothetical protein